ncbi:MAG: hypothetical protein R3C14_20705 [Caldilineaceae bacterium]
MIQPLTHAPHHHFFGYYGISPWNRTQRHHLTLATNFDDRAVEVGDKAVVGLVDMVAQTVRPLAETAAFNLQQGSMLHWIQVGQAEEFTYNDWEGDQLVTRAVDPQTGQRRTLCAAIAAVSPTEPVAIGLNFARMRLCRRVVGYANAHYSPANIIAQPEDDGLFLIDLRTGEARLLLSIAEVARHLSVDGAAGQPHWFNHVIFNTDGTRLIFFCRIQQPGRRFLDSVWTVNSDGTELACQIPYGYTASHLAWMDPQRLMISTDVLGQMQFVTFRDRHGDFTPYGGGHFPSDGHNAFSPNFRFIACDARLASPRHGYILLLYDIQRNAMHTLGEFEHPPHVQGDWRCDLHPRWSPDGRLISFDSVHEGTRQIYMADVTALVGM